MFLYDKGKQDEGDKLAAGTTGSHHSVLALFFFKFYLNGTLATGELGSLCLTPFSSPQKSLFTRPIAIKRLRWTKMTCVVPTASKRGVKKTWDSTVLKHCTLSSVTETEHGAKVKLLPDTCHKYFKRIIDLYIFLYCCFLFMIVEL